MPPPPTLRRDKYLFLCLTPSEGVTNGLYRQLYPTIIRDYDVSSQHRPPFKAVKEREVEGGRGGERERGIGEEDGRL